MNRITKDMIPRRELLRRRLLELASAETAYTPTLLEAQIDELLEDVLADDPLLQPAPALLDHRDEDQRVVVTGMGAVTPLGLSVAESWNGIVEGRNGVGRITSWNTGDIPCKIAAEVRGFDPHTYMEPKEARRISRASQFAVAAARMALDDSGFVVTDDNRYDVGALIGNGSTSPPDTELMTHTLYDRGWSKINPFYITAVLPNMPSSQVAIQLGLMGYNTTTATACAASTQAIGEAAEIIRRGDATVMLAGGTEAPICQITLASFQATRALSMRNDDPAHASRPFDAGRDGFVLAEGAGVLVLEQLTHARRRGAHIYAEIIGYATTCDAYHVTSARPDGSGAAMAMGRAMARARIGPQQIDYINAHATSTPSGDIAETEAIKRAFGEYAYSIPISSTKSMLGHLTSAAGSIESIVSILALKHGVIPPTMNYEIPDPKCDLDYVPNQARYAPLQTVMSNSFAFGGVNAVLIFRKPSAGLGSA